MCKIFAALLMVSSERWTLVQNIKSSFEVLAV